MPRESKFNFSPISQLSVSIEEKQKPSITINPKGVIFFSKKYLEEYNAVGKFARFFADRDKKVLGWTLNKSVNQEELKSTAYRVLKMNSCKSVMVSLATTLKLLDSYGEKLSNLTVEEYIDKLFGVIHYVKLPKKNEQLYPKPTDIRNTEENICNNN